MPRISVQHIKRKNRLSANDLTLIIRKKARGALVAYNFNGPKIGWYAYFTNQTEPKFIGPNWVAAHNSIAQLPDGTFFKRFIPKLLGGAL